MSHGLAGCTTIGPLDGHLSESGKTKNWLRRSARGHRPGTPAMTNLCAHRELRRSVEIPNTQWALYPMGGGISAGGAVITAWFFTAPFITAHVDASD